MARLKRSVERVKHSLQLEEDVDLHEKGWAIQRIGWVLMLLIILSGALGLFGEGVLSKKRPKAGDVTAEYDQFFRYETEMKIIVESTGTNISTIALPQNYLKDFRVVRFVPEPFGNIAEAEDVIFNFHGTRNRIITIYVIPKTYGSINGNLKVNELNRFELHHYIYP